MAEPPQLSRVGAPRSQLGLSNLSKISSYRGEDKTRRRFEIVQQAAPSTLSFPERNSLDSNSAVLDVSGTYYYCFFTFSFMIDRSGEFMLR